MLVYTMDSTETKKERATNLMADRPIPPGATDHSTKEATDLFSDRFLTSLVPMKCRMKFHPTLYNG